MSHRTLIDGTAYDVIGGTTKINGTGYTISGGRTLIDNTGYDISIAPKFHWDDASWADLNDLCIQKQNGEISEFPEEVVVKNKKTLTVNGETFTAQLICVDEIPGTMTFFILDYPYYYKFGNQSDYTVKYSNSPARAGTEWCYNNMCAEVKDIIIPVVKRSSILLSTKQPSYEDTTEYVFIPSVVEFTGLNQNWYNELSYDDVGTVYNGQVINHLYTTQYDGLTNAGNVGSGTKTWWSRDRASYYENSSEIYDTDIYVLTLDWNNKKTQKFIGQSLQDGLTQEYKILPTFIIGRQGV